MAYIALLGILLIAVAAPLAAGRIGPNRFYGFRTPRVVKDERVWYPVNRMAGRQLMTYGLFLIGMGSLSWLGLLGVTAVSSITGLSALVLVASLFVSAARIVGEIDKGGAPIDYRSSFEQTRQKQKKDPDAARQKLLDRIK